MSQSRQLAAIMFTDIVGYTALMGHDEQKAFSILNQNRSLQKPIIEQFNGRWIKELGDGVMASFNTVSDAVNAAIKIQETCNAAKDFQLRIGIHLGEVIFENDDVFGDGVNIASRIQAIAEPGGIYISESVYNNISNKQGIKTKFVKLETLKNVKEPVRIYEVMMTNGAGAIIEYQIKKIPQNSIAVLPFTNMSSDPEQEFFSDGLTEEIITDLSRLEKLLVISRSSIMTFKGTNKKIKEIANEVNVRYILEGSVRKSGNNLRITAQLIDSLNDAHLWAEKYTGTLDDVFEIQENVSRSIVKALDVKLTTEEDSRLSQHPIEDAKAHECYILARQEIWKFTEAGFNNAIVLIQRGLDIVGENAFLYASLSLTYLFIQHYGIRNDPSDLVKANKYGLKSLELDADLPQTQFVQGVLSFKKGDLQRAANIFRKVLQEDQNNPDALHFLIVTLAMAGKANAGFPLMKKLLQVDPLTINTYAFPGVVELYSGNIQESMPHFQKWYDMDPQGPFTLYWYANVLALNNKLEECIKILNRIINDTPALIFAKFALFFKSALQGDKESALKHASTEMKSIAATLDYLPIFMALSFTLINEKDEAVSWLKKSLDFGYSPYPLLLKLEIFQRGLKDHEGFKAFMKEVKRRSEEFVV
ncbi:adenylate/guanylate cyclase domain-containing protein [soil metagenome]